MSDVSVPQSQTSALRRALAALEQMQARLDAAERARREPVAIVGMGCRFPGGVDSPESFWRLLRDGVDAVTEVPADRWDMDALFDPDPDAPGRIASRFGAFVDGVDGFDPAFFGITPREAAGMDPQQRLLLETAWEALENAGIAPDRLGGSATGVFVGIVNADYEQLARERGGQEQFGAYFASGNAQSVASGRISYLLGLQGPSLSIDTACSSSLVAVHQAVQSLRSGECRLAIAGGVNAILTPESSIAISKYRMLAPDGRCKTFDAAADGFARGEGCGVIVLKRLSDAIADGDRVLATIRGSAVNQDGASSGLTAPNGPAQEAVIRAALADAGVQPHQVGYVEAHGTGTSLGDPIEIQALGAALGTGRAADRPLLVGSVKTNVGHLESAAGIAGLIKLVLCLQHGEIPPHLHLRTPNPLIPWDRLPVRVPREATSWPDDGERVGGVSSFGFSGTNAHLVLASTPASERSAPLAERPLHVLTLSGRDDAALRQQAERVAAHLAAHPELPVGDVCHTAGAGRAHGSRRLAFSAASTDDARDGLEEWLAGRERSGLRVGAVPPGDAPRVAFLFTGQGSQYVGMGRQLWHTEPVFRSALQRCADLLEPLLPRPLLSVLFPAPGDEAEAERLLARTEFTQPALFALEWSLSELWQHWGVRPHAVLGHSVGEYTAACVAGVFSLEQGLTLIAERGRLMGALPEGGAMAAVFADAEVVEEAISDDARHLAIAAINGPQSVVLSGSEATLRSALERLAARGVQWKPLRVSHAFHSPLMEPVLGDFERAAGRVDYAAPTLRLVSNVSGGLAAAEQVATPGYWVRHVRAPVRFAGGVQALRAEGCGVFLEVGPGSTLLGMARAAEGAETEEQAGHGSGSGSPAMWLPSLRRAADDHAQMLDSLAALHVAGVSIDWEGVDRPFGARPVALPTYPFQRQRFWVADGVRTRSSDPAARDVHPLLGRRLRSALPQVQFDNEFGADRFGFIADHLVQGAPILPAAGFVEMALAAATQFFGEGDGPPAVEDLVILEPLRFEPDAARVVQTVVDPTDAAGVAFRVLSQSPGDEPWRLHATGRLATDADNVAEPGEPLDAIRARCSETRSADDHHARMRAHGLDFGPAMHGVAGIHRRDGEAMGQIRAPECVAREIGAFRLHPALLDACLQVIAAALPGAGLGAPYLPLAIERIRCLGRAGAELWSHVVVELPDEPRPETLRADVRLLDASGTVVASLTRISLRRGATAVPAAEAWADWLYRVEWRPVDRTTALTLDLPTCAAPSPAQVADAATAALPDAAERFGLDAEHALFPHLEALATDYVANALRRLGCPLTPGARFSSDDAFAACGIAPRHRRLFVRLLGILAEDGVLARDGEGWKVLRAPEPATPDAIAANLLLEHPASDAQIGLVARCGAALADVLTGAADPLALLFPDGSLDLAEALYRDSPKSRVFNRLIQEAVATAVSGTGDRRLRVLEIGAGTGATTASVLPVLPADRTEYVFSDLSPAFLARARERFDGFSFVDYQLLDIERDPAEQNFGGRRFDLVLAVNVLHATADLARTLRHVRSLLAPGGMLVLVEGTGPERWIDVSFGLTDGWWRFADTHVRPDYPLLPPAKWRRLLDAAGFESVAVAPPDAERHRQAIVLARTAPAIGAEPASWLIVGDGAGVGDRLAALLRDRGHAAARVVGGGAVRQCLEAAMPADAGAAPLRGIVSLTALDAPEPTGADSLEPAVRHACEPVLDAVRVLGGRAGEPPRLWLATRGAQPVAPDEPLAAIQAAAWGLATVLRREHPELRCATVDLDPADDAGRQAADMLAEILGPDREDRVAVRDGVRYAARLAQLALPAPALPEVVAPNPETPAERPVRLAAAASGVLEEMAWTATERRAPGAGEIEIRVHATGLNFRDVMNALGMRADGDPLGGECSGTVAAVGAGVEGIRVGNEVIAVAAGGFATYVTVSADLVLPKPARLGWAEAAGQPLAFLTAFHCLHGVGKLAAGERILIHAAAGGVGLAAVRLALRAGAEVLATAGSETKREFLRSLGVRHVFDSRSTGFAEEVLRVTGGCGVDLVLNSLAGEFIGRGLHVLAERGRFVEIGKRDIWTPEQVAAARPGTQYHVVDLAARLGSDPASVRPVFHAAMEPVIAGDVEPLPVTVFDAAGVADAFRFMAQARHIGKIVVTQATESKAPGQHGAPGVPRRDGTYFVTGGLGGLGLLTARWLAERGAGALVLMGRRPPGEAAAAVIREIEAIGARVRVVAGDVSVAADVRRVLDGIEGDLPPLRGIVHSAGVLEDGALMRQEWAGFARVLAPKVDGAWLLHTLTRDQSLDFFVLFSSVASILGSPGQASHAAANAFLDALVHRRRAEGLPALAIGWGLWSEIGSAAARGTAQRIGGQGVGSIDPAAGLRILDRAMAGDVPYIAVQPVDWERYAAATGGMPTWLSEVADGSQAGVAAAVRVHDVAIATRQPVDRSFADRLARAAAADRREMLLEHLQEQVGRVIGLRSGETVDPRQPLNDLGVDSLMAVELRNRIGSTLGLVRALPATLVFDHPTVAALTDFLGAIVLPSEPDAPGSAPDAPPADLLDQIEGLSDEDVERLFAGIEER